MLRGKLSINPIKIGKSALRRLLWYYGYAVDRPTEPRLILELLAQLHPVQTQHPLIRVGGIGDGGYLIPEDLDGVSACFSPGVSSVADFEDGLARRGIKSFLADYSVDGPPVVNPLLEFEKRYIGHYDDDVFLTMETWVRNKAEDSSEFILQMDIEGGEYAALLSTPLSVLRKFRILVVEFHSLDRLFERGSFELISLTLNRLVREFDVVHIHPNNCCGVRRYKDLIIPSVMEFTFLRKDRVSTRTPIVQFPHPLDRKNVGANPDIVLPDIWYRQT